MKPLKLFFHLFFCFLTSFSYSQGEFILEIDPATGAYTQPTLSINGVTYVQSYVSTYDEINGLYIFPSTGPNQLITVNSNDSIHYNPPFTSIFECQHDNSSGILYGLKNPSTNQFIFGSVNPSTGSFSQLSTGPISGMNGIYQGLSTFDKNASRYIIYVGGNILFTINALTGTVISNPAAVLNSGESLIHICFDDSSNTLYGLLQINNSNTTFLVHIDTSTGAITKIGTASPFGFGGGTATIDKLNRRYIYHYYSNGGYYIAVRNLLTGNIIYNNLIPISTGDNINSIEYDNIRKKLYAQHWDSKITTGIETYGKANSLIVYPNPATNSIRLETTAELGTILVYNALGEILLQTTSKNNQEQIDISHFPSGIYMIHTKEKYTKLIKN